MKNNDDYILDGENAESVVPENDIHAEFLNFYEDCENGKITPYQCRIGCSYYKKDENTFIEYCLLTGARVRSGKMCHEFDVVY